MTESPRTTAPAGRSVIGADVIITGDIGSEGTVEIMGKIDGKIAARSVVIGAEGRIAGSISAESIDLRGQMEGKMSCASLTLRSVSQVRADVNYHSLTIESGAQIDGKFTRAKG